MTKITKHTVYQFPGHGSDAEGERVRTGFDDDDATPVGCLFNLILIPLVIAAAGLGLGVII